MLHVTSGSGVASTVHADGSGNLEVDSNAHRVRMSVGLFDVWPQSEQLRVLRGSRSTFHVGAHFDASMKAVRASRRVAFMPVSRENFEVDEREGSAAYGDDEPLHTHRSLAPHLC